jgi:DNA-binding GntR family transcriptional regulator
MPKLKSINQPLPLAKMAYEVLRDSILNGELGSGEIYNEMALAKDLGISRTPVREALLELAVQGLVVFLPRRGVMIKHLTKQDVLEIFELREAIELAAIEKVIKKRASNNLVKIERMLQAQRKALGKNDHVDFMKADRTFHAVFSEMTKNRRFVNILENVRDLVHFMGMQGLSVEGRAEDVIAEHEKILEAVKEGDLARAREATIRHLESSRDAVLKSLTERGEDV